jgi:hypothetical protein
MFPGGPLGKALLLKSGKSGNVLVAAPSLRFAREETLILAVGLAAGFVFAAGRWTIRFVDKNVVVASGTDHAVNRLGELLVSRVSCGMLAARQRSAHSHWDSLNRSQDF